MTGPPIEFAVPMQYLPFFQKIKKNKNFFDTEIYCLEFQSKLSAQESETNNLTEMVGLVSFGRNTTRSAKKLSKQNCANQHDHAMKDQLNYSKH
ncbi:hypothetical protein BpHYR1_053305 [Brachionus plicatilis]|uniref:Uncharacterized protein n=1 Tax=Brachionus plicatilis TaxID=10195 RepID=A0A3M7T3S5_BRAPC|nr:hypothetical protein BpHYR1_053305 [Brachionus plicatilis]